MHEQWSPLVEITSSLFPFVLLCFNPVREKNRHQSKTIRRENIMNRRENEASSPASSFHIIRVYVSMCVASPLVFTERKIDVTKLRIDIMWILLALVEDNDKLYRTKNDILSIPFTRICLPFPFQNIDLFKSKHIATIMGITEPRGFGCHSLFRSIIKFHSQKLFDWFCSGPHVISTVLSVLRNIRRNKKIWYDATVEMFRI